MGWKAVKDSYRIRHTVFVDKRTGNICIGSGYLPEIIAVSPSGEIVKRYGDRVFDDNPDLLRYQSEMDADPERLRVAASSKDVFATAIPVYYREGSEILQTFCEEFGYPNVTHCGDVMYENTHFKTPREAALKGLKELASSIELQSELIAEDEEKLRQRRLRLEKTKADLDTLERVVTNL